MRCTGGGPGGALAAENGLAPITTCAGYLNGDTPLDDLALASFEVQDVLAFDQRRLKRCLRERGIGRVEVKKRGVDVEPASLERKLRGRGDDRAVLLLAKLDRRTVAILARRQVELASSLSCNQVGQASSLSCK